MVLGSEIFNCVKLILKNQTIMLYTCLKFDETSSYFLVPQGSSPA